MKRSLFLALTVFSVIIIGTTAQAGPPHIYHLEEYTDESRDFHLGEVDYLFTEIGTIAFRQVHIRGESYGIIFGTIKGEIFIDAEGLSAQAYTPLNEVEKEAFNTWFEKRIVRIVGPVHYR